MGKNKQNKFKHTKQSHIQYCRHDPTEVATVDGVTLYGASGSRVSYSTIPIDTILLALIPHDEPEILTVPQGYRSLLKTVPRYPPVIELDWEDGSEPPVLDKFWTTLHRELKRRQQNLLTFCFGGHGRTGTGLASYLIANQGMLASAAIKHVRKHLCEQCVETQAQMEYLFMLASNTGVQDHEFDELFPSSWLKYKYDDTPVTRRDYDVKKWFPQDSQSRIPSVTDDPTEERFLDEETPTESTEEELLRDPYAYTDSDKYSG